MAIADTGLATVRSDGRCRVFLALVIVALGIQAIVTQSLLLREALVLMYGSEFAWGIVLFAWLFGVAIGAFIGGRLAERFRGAGPGFIGRAELGLVGVLLGLSVVACVDLWVFRGARAWLGVEPGELLPIPKTVVAALLFVSPASAFVGVAFPLAACMASTPEPQASARAGSEPSTENRSARILPLGTIYALESAGSLVGGAAFSFFAVEHAAPIQTALICGAITTASLAALLGLGKRSPRGAFALTVPAVGALVLAAVAGDGLEEKLVQRRWRNIAPGYELRAQVETKYQNLAVGQRAEQFTLYSNGLVISDFPDPYTFVPLAHFWLCQHPRPQNILVLGGGAEGLLAEILRHDVQHLDYVEPDPRQIELIEPYLTDADRGALKDPRVTVHHVDARFFVKTQRDRFDLVIARLPEPMSALAARFYSAEFFGELRQAMSPRSVLCMTAAAAPGQLSTASAEYLASLRATLAPSFPHVLVGWGDPAHLFAATAEGLVSTDGGTLAARYIERSVESDWFDPVWFDGATDWLDPLKVQQRADQLDAVTNPRTSTDFWPSAYMQRLALWERMTSKTVHGMIERIRSVGWLEVISGLLAISGLTLLSGYVRERVRHRTPLARTNSAVPNQWFTESAVVLSIAGTGLVTMALSIVWLFAFQTLYGYVYQRIGWIIALFMAGLVLGCSLTDRRLNRLTVPTLLARRLWWWLVVVDLLLAALSLSVPLILPKLGGLQTTATALMLVEWCISIMVALTGVLGGAAFALSARLHLSMTGRSGRTAGVIVGADHAGACVGALLSGILLVPVLGIAATAWLLAGVKMGSAVLLVVARRLSRAA